MIELMIIILGLAILVNSLIMLLTDSVTYDSILGRYTIVKFVLVLTFLTLIVVLPWQLGSVARDEISVFPWEVWSQQSSQHGLVNGMLAVIINLIFLLWTFLLPAHLYAHTVERKTGVRPMCPYAMNVLGGLILCSPHNPIYQFLKMLL